MGRYVVRRLLWTGLVILVVTFLTFLIFFVMMPGNKAVRFAGKQPTPEIVAEVEKQFGLDKPVFGITLPQVWESRPWESQYGLYLRRLVVGDGDTCPVGIDGCGWPGLGISYDSRSAVRAGDHRTVATDARARDRCRDRLASHGRPDRRRVGAQARLGGRPRRHGLRALRRLRAGLLAGADRALHLLEKARDRRSRDGLRRIRRRTRSGGSPTCFCPGSCSRFSTPRCMPG